MTLLQTRKRKLAYNLSNDKIPLEIFLCDFFRCVKLNYMWMKIP